MRASIGTFTGKRVLVTGAYGFVGRQLVDYLIHHENAEVFVTQRDNDISVRHGTDFKTTRFFNHQWWNLCRTITCDLRVREDAERAVAIAQPDVVFHLAAISQVTEASLTPILTYETNVMGLVNLLEAVNGFKTKVPVIIASSDKAYGKAEGELDENAVCIPGHPYDTSKACADLIAQSYANYYGMPTAVARMGNIFGRGDLNWKRIIPGVCRWVLTNEDIIIRSDGQSRREYISVDAVIWAYLGLAEYLMAGIIKPGEIVNFGGTEATPLQLVEGIIKIVGEDNYDGKVKVLNIAQDENPSITLNDYKANFHLGWYYDNKKFAIDLKAAVRWYINYFEELRSGLV